MKTEQLAELFRKGFTAIGMAPDQATIDQFLFYLQEVVKWNTKTNLTGHKNEQEMIGNLLSTPWPAPGFFCRKRPVPFSILAPVPGFLGFL